MRGGVAAAVVFLALVTAPLAGAGSRAPAAGTSMTVAASRHVAGAHGVRLALTLHYWMQCGYAGAGPLVVTFPAALRLPKQFATGTVTLAGRPVATNVDGHQVTVRVAPHRGILCDVMARGSLTLAFAPAARLVNPTHKGSYRFTATHLRRTFAARLAIKPASS